MALVTSSKFFLDRAFLIQELGLKKCPKKKGCASLGERICRLWRSICEYFSPKIYQKKLNRQLQEIKKELEEGKYQKKIESFYKKFVQEAKEEMSSTFDLSSFSLDSRESIEQLTSQMHRLGQPLQGKLLLIADCFEWKEKMIEQRKEVLRHVEGAKVKNSVPSYELISWMIKKAKELILHQSKDVKSYSYFMREFASASSNVIIQEANLSLSRLEQDKSKSLEKFLEEKKKIQACIEKLKLKTHPSTSRMNALKGMRKSAESKINATKSSYSELYGEWSRGMDEIKTTMSRKICSDNLELLAFWKKKLNDLVKSKEHLDPVIEMLVRLDRICLTLESSTDPNGIKLLNSGLSLSLKEAASVALKEWSDSPKHAHDQISKHLQSLIGSRIAFLEEKIGKFLPQSAPIPLMNEEEKLISELEDGGLKRHPIQKEANCLFDACVKGGQEMSDAPVLLKAMNGAAFRKALYEYMKINRADYLVRLVTQLKEDLTPMVLISEEFAQKKLSGDDLEVWLFTEGAHKYLDGMSSCNALAGEVEIEAISKMVNVPIRVYSASYPGQFKDIGEYPVDRTKALHLFRTKSGHYDVLVPVEIG